MRGMRTLRDLGRPPPHIIGRVEWIIVRGRPREPARSVEATQALAGIGLVDDRPGQGGEAELSTRQVTLIQHEHLPVIARLAQVAVVDPIGLRRNLVVSGINGGLNAGINVLYSGTIGGAMEATLQGLPAIALSQFYGPGNLARPDPFEVAAVHGARVVRPLLDHGNVLEHEHRNAVVRLAVRHVQLQAAGAKWGGGPRGRLGGVGGLGLK